MRYYELAVFGFYLQNLTFHSKEEIPALREVIIDLKNKKNCDGCICHRHRHAKNVKMEG